MMPGLWCALWHDSRGAQYGMKEDDPAPPCRPATLGVHAGTYFNPRTGGACSPIFPSTAYAFPNPTSENYYPRYFNTPNQRVLEKKSAALADGLIRVSVGIEDIEDLLDDFSGALEVVGCC